MRRLLDRNIATLVLVVLVGQLLAAGLLYQLVMRPQTRRLAEVTAEMTDAIGKSMARMSPAERRDLVSRFNANDAVLIRPGEQVPEAGLRRPTLIEYDFLVAISHRLNQDQPVEWRADPQSRLWVHLWLGGEDWWVSLTSRRLRVPLTSTAIALGSALLAAVVGGIVLQRYIDKPLRRLVGAVDAYDPDAASLPISEDGPLEIAAVAHAFNRLIARLALQDAERAVMLGAVSHDLRTPLTRLRLSLAMMHVAEAELLESAERQVDRIEAMLGQFLDFARGFEGEAKQSVELAALLHRVALESDARGDLALAIGPGLRVLAGPIALERAVANLVGNALRYGAPPYRLEAYEKDDRIEIAVGDSGQGFAPLLAASLCRPFARGDRARGGEGAGLGLAIAQRIVGACDGTLDFTFSAGLFWAIIAVPKAVGGRC